MTTDLKNALTRRGTGDGHTDLDLDDEFGPLLQAMLAGIRRHRETPLLAGFDSLGIVCAALQSRSNGPPQMEAGPLPDPETVKAAFNLLVERTLLDEAQAEIRLAGSEQVNHAAAGVREKGCEKAPRLLAGWLEDFYTVIRDAHPRAFEIVELRLQGYNNRDVAEQLGLTLRLVKRIVHDTQRAWEIAMGKE